MVVPSGAATIPARRFWTYSRSASLAASLATLGRFARRSACHCAVMARYSRLPQRVAALRLSSREIVDGERPSWEAISRTTQRLCVEERDIFSLGEGQV